MPQLIKKQTFQKNEIRECIINLIDRAEATFSDLLRGMEISRGQFQLAVGEQTEAPVVDLFLWVVCNGRKNIKDNKRKPKFSNLRLYQLCCVPFLFCFLVGEEKQVKKGIFMSCLGISVSVPWMLGFGVIYEGFGFGEEEQRVEKMRKTMFG